MYPIRIVCSVAAVLLGSLVVNAAPMPDVQPHHVQPGSVFTAKPVHFDPPLVCNLNVHYYVARRYFYFLAWAFRSQWT